MTLILQVSSVVWEAGNGEIFNKAIIKMVQFFLLIKLSHYSTGFLGVAYRARH